MRRFPTIPQEQIGFEGAPMYYMVGGVLFLVLGTLVARAVFEDNKIESTKRHHPKGIGFTGIDQQKEHKRLKAVKVSPNIDENYYEYSRKKHRVMPNSC
jgi:hypothetical protein